MKKVVKHVEYTANFWPVDWVPRETKIRGCQYHCEYHMQYPVTGWWFGTMEFYFPFHIWDVILPIDELTFFKMVIAPPTRLDSRNIPVIPRIDLKETGGSWLPGPSFVVSVVWFSPLRRDQREDQLAGFKQTRHIRRFCLGFQCIFALVCVGFRCNIYYI